MRRLILMTLVSAGLIGANPALAQVRTVDPNTAIDSDLSAPRAQQEQETPPRPIEDSVPIEQSQPQDVPGGTATEQAASEDSAAPQPNVTGVAPGPRDDTYKRDDLLAAGERAFGKGAAGLGGILEKILKDQGEPNAYIVGREGSGAIGVGLRYGSGTLSHKIEGEQPIYWTGPSLGFDLGGDAAKVFVLVYNLYDTEEAFKRFPGGEGRLYLIGGFSATYQRRGNIVLIPVRLGVGWRAGVNVGYTKYSHKSKWFPF